MDIFFNPNSNMICHRENLANFLSPASLISLLFPKKSLLRYNLHVYI